MQATKFNIHALKNFNRHKNNLNELSYKLEEVSLQHQVSIPAGFCFKYLSECVEHISELIKLGTGKKQKNNQETQINNLAQKLLYARQYLELAQKNKYGSTKLLSIENGYAETTLTNIEALFTKYIYKPCFSDREKKKYEKTKKQITKFAIAHPDKEYYGLELQAGTIQAGWRTTLPALINTELKVALGDIFSELIQRTVSELGVEFNPQDPPNFGINIAVDFNNNTAIEDLIYIDVYLDSGSLYLSQSYNQTDAYKKLKEQVEFIVRFMTAKYIQPDVASAFSGKEQPEGLLFSFVSSCKD